MSRSHLTAVLAAFALAGCGLLTAPRTISPQFFVLNAVAVESGTATPIHIGLGPVSLPSYLDRPEMARRVDPNQIAYDAEARWAESLQGNFQRTVAANLVLLLHPTRIEVEFLPPLTAVDGAVEEASTALRDRARREILAALGEPDLSQAA